MQTYTTISDAVAAVRSIAFNPPATLPEDIKAALLKVASEISPVSAIVGCAELIFARRAELDADTLAIASGLASFATENGWHGLASDDRGVGLVSALRRDAGDKPISRSWPKEADDPAPLERFVKADPLDEAPALLTTGAKQIPGA